MESLEPRGQLLRDAFLVSSPYRKTSQAREVEPLQSARGSKEEAHSSNGARKSTQERQELKREEEMTDHDNQMTNQQDKHQRAILPIPDRPYTGLITYDAKDPDTHFPPIEPIRPPEDAPNVLVVLIDDVGFSASSAFGGPCETPNFERLANGGLRYNRFHTTALCAPTRAAMLTGRNHHSVGMGGVTEIATSAPGNDSVRPNTKAPLAQTLQLNGYSTSQFGKCHEVPVWQSSRWARLTCGRPARGSSTSTASSAARTANGTRRSTRARRRSSRPRARRRLPPH